MDRSMTRRSMRDTDTLVANIDAISAKEAVVASDPKKARMKPYTRVEVPPLTSPPWKVLLQESQPLASWDRGPMRTPCLRLP